MVYITGDMHGERRRILHPRIKRLKEKDTLIVLGDFGFLWSGSEKENKFLQYLGSRRYYVCFIDGPHDNHDLINTHRETVWNGGLVHRIYGNCFHLCRGQIFKIEGRSYFTFGGGETAEIEMRKETRFKQELPSIAEISAGEENLREIGNQVDVILTHEPPTKIKRSLLFRTGEAEQINYLNSYLEEIGELCRFRRWYFGSCHEDRPITEKHTAVYKAIIPMNDDELEGQILTR